MGEVLFTAPRRCSLPSASRYGVAVARSSTLQCEVCAAACTHPSRLLVLRPSGLAGVSALDQYRVHDGQSARGGEICLLCGIGLNVWPSASPRGALLLMSQVWGNIKPYPPLSSPRGGGALLLMSVKLWHLCGKTSRT